MIKPLRKRHLQIWILLAFLLPVGIMSAWVAIPKPVRDHLLQPETTAALPVILKTIETQNYTASLRETNDKTALQLEWINKSALTSPSAIIYEISSAKGGNNLDGAALIGRISGRGVYHFPLKMDITNNHLHFVLYDIIHHRVIDRIIF